MPGSYSLKTMLNRARQRAERFNRPFDEEAVIKQWRRYNGIQDEDKDKDEDRDKDDTSGTSGNSGGGRSSSSNNSYNSGNIGSQRPKSPPTPPWRKLLPLTPKAPPARRRSRSPVPAAHRQYVEVWIMYLNLKVDDPPPPASTEARQVAAKILREKGWDISNFQEFQSL